MGHFSAWAGSVALAIKKLSAAAQDTGALDLVAQTVAAGASPAARSS